MTSTNKFLASNQGKNPIIAPLNSAEKALIVHESRSDRPQVHASTERALILRKAAGELVVSRKIGGQEKLALLADELMTTAIRPRMDMEELLRIADSQLWLHLSEVSNLKDPLFFYDDIMATIESRLESVPDKDGRKSNFVINPQWIASVIGSRLYLTHRRLHNLYLLSAGWRIVKTVLRELKTMHIDASEVREQLGRNVKLRSKYLLLYDMVTTLARLGQQRVANIAAATPHYAGFFRLVKLNGAKEDTEPRLEFDRQNANLRQLRQAHKSFIDAIVLELTLPNSQYPPYVLMTLLRDATDECKKEETRFSQTLWDAIGDFATTIQVLDMIEGPLLNEQGDNWLRNSVLSKEYVEFLRMQDLSQEAIKASPSWSTCFGRLIDTKDKDCLDLLWKTINESYRKATGRNVEALWSLQGEMQRPAQWFFKSNAYMDDDNSDGDDRALVPHPAAMSKSNRDTDRLRITSGQRADDDDDDDMPELICLSDSSEDPDLDTFERSPDNDGGYESDFDEAEDEMYQEDLHEAMDQMIDMFLDANSELLEQERNSSNPFVRMFANLRDRYFASNSTLHPDEKSRTPYKSRFGGQPHQATPASDNQPTETDPSKPLESRPQGMTIGDVEDEDEDEDEEVHPKKKKKKKKKRSKKSLDHPQKGHEDEGKDQDHPPRSPVVHVAPSVHSPSSVQLPQSSPPPAPSPTRASRVSSTNSPPGKPRFTAVKQSEESSYSQVSLPLPELAQSARSYIQAENLNVERNKIKSRPSFASKLFSPGGDNKFNTKDEEQTSKKKTFLQNIKKINLPKKAGELMHRLIGSTSGKTHAKKTMKWDDFVKVAHPDTTLQRHHLRDFGKKLTRMYGWREEMFSTFGVEENEPYED
ncbi:hypothetical protein Clacol_000571 [Clathrus columnatus]|uniref:Uncharacterized protein n=1 Tax=Clathrus columnatus TaxID=1419009 RepID=A0AAV5A048_9AGAM|nr:hypothetical protein Clacol_000571 [Clathrus columnatus]